MVQPPEARAPVSRPRRPSASNAKMKPTCNTAGRRRPEERGLKPPAGPLASGGQSRRWNRPEERRLKLWSHGKGSAPEPDRTSSGATPGRGSWPMSVRRAWPRCARRSTRASRASDASYTWPSCFFVTRGWSSDMTISLFGETQYYKAGAGRVGRHSPEPQRALDRVCSGQRDPRPSPGRSGAPEPSASRRT